MEIDASVGGAKVGAFVRALRRAGWGLACCGVALCAGLALGCDSGLTRDLGTLTADPMSQTVALGDDAVITVATHPGAPSSEVDLITITIDESGLGGVVSSLDDPDVVAASDHTRGLLFTVGTPSEFTFTPVGEVDPVTGVSSTFYQTLTYTCRTEGTATIVLSAEFHRRDGSVDRPEPVTVTITCVAPFDAGPYDAGFDAGSTGPTDASTDATMGGLTLCDTGRTEQPCMNARDCPAVPPTVGTDCLPFQGTCYYCIDGNLADVSCYRCTEFEPYALTTVDCSMP